ncbi:hypothetical protein BJX76DRAFT_321200 [Aspergillus varians]
MLLTTCFPFVVLLSNINKYGSKDRARNLRAQVVERAKEVVCFLFLEMQEEAKKASATGPSTPEGGRRRDRLFSKALDKARRIVRGLEVHLGNSEGSAAVSFDWSIFVLLVGLLLLLGTAVIIRPFTGTYSVGTAIFTSESRDVTCAWPNSYSQAGQ